jgi:hypothetical protein
MRAKAKGRAESRVNGAQSKAFLDFFIIQLTLSTFPDD